MKLHIPVKGHFSFAECLWYLNRNFDDCLYEVLPDRVRKALMTANGPVLFEVSEAENPLSKSTTSSIEDTAGGVESTTSGVDITILSGQPDLAFLQQFVTGWFDLDSELHEFYDLLLAHSALAYMPKRYHGLRLIGIPDLFDALSWSIIGQQINLRFAYTLKRRMVEHYGSFLEYDGKRYYMLPDYATLAAADPQVLRSMQFSTRKAEYLISLAQAFADGTISKEKLLALPDFTARQQLLVSMRGIGIWTANYALMKSLRERAGIPYGDAGLLNALLAHAIIKDKKDEKKIAAFFKKFKGWETYVVAYLWRSLAPTAEELKAKE
jgi:DNA-3-methyladenine glycosylase II